MTLQQLRTSVLGALIFLVAHGEGAPVPSVFVSVSFNTPWSEVCHIDDFFENRLSEVLIEANGDHGYQLVSPSRIKFINVEKECKKLGNQKRHEKGALEFYISTEKEDSTVDKTMTVRAFNILHDYWINKKMVEMDSYFVGKVTNVKIFGKEAPVVPETFTEEERTWVGIAAGLLFVVLLSLIAILKHQYRPVKVRSLISLRRKLRREVSSKNVYGETQSYALETYSLATIGIVELALKEKADSTKKDEFQSLGIEMPSKELYPPKTANKNRSPHVLPVLGTRVKLSSGEDYINANFVRDHKGQPRYIATQHPLEETVEDFWRMVLDQQVSVVVMVNEEQEMNPSEYEDYFSSDEENTKKFGDIAVTVKRITKNTDYVLTTLAVVDWKADTTPRDVTHFRFVAWASREMPSVSSFATFAEAIREFKKEHDVRADTPTIVHCSDGQRFTGIYIAVDVGFQSNEENKTTLVDVFELSKRMRKDRNGIISSIEYYSYIYQVLYEHLVNRGEIQDAKL